MWELIFVAVFAVPIGIALVILKQAMEDGMDASRQRLARQPAVARRLPHLRALWKLGGSSCALVLLPLAVGVNGADSDQWEVIGLVVASLLGLGSTLLGLWWLLAGRKESNLSRGERAYRASAARDGGDG